MNEFNREKVSEAIDAVSGELGSDGQKLKDAVNAGSMDQLLKNLKPGDAQKLQQILSNKEETERMLKSPQAQMLMKLFLKNPPK